MLGECAHMDEILRQQHSRVAALQLQERRPPGLRVLKGVGAGRRIRIRRAHHRGDRIEGLRPNLAAAAAAAAAVGVAAAVRRVAFGLEQVREFARVRVDAVMHFNDARLSSLLDSVETKEEEMEMEAILWGASIIISSSKVYVRASSW